ncbi:DotG/IcmE/VirB10 family protein [Vibrio vulnificus]|uniref:DotG/IcmE/VirB10 family protein n=1 Tax=Vibrio vulnificus TaxID=672 RepID=UPI004059AC18
MSEKVANSKSKKNTLFVVAGIGVVLIGIIVFVAISISNVITTAKQEVAKSRGSQTMGSATLELNEIRDANVDAEITIDPNSPQAIEAQLREEGEREKAVEKGESFISKTRIINSAEEKALELPSPVEVNELGQEIVDVNASKTNEMSDGLNEKPKANELAKTSERSDDPLGIYRDNTELGNQPQTALPFENNGQGTAQARAEQEIKLLELMKTKEDLLKEKRINNAKSLYSGLEFVPPVNDELVVKLPDIGTNPYSKTTTIAFEQNGETTNVASALYRNDGGQTRPSIHGNYFRQEIDRAKNQVDHQSPTASDDNKMIQKGGVLELAQLALPIDSDAPGPLKVDIKTGVFKGGYGIGSFELLNNSAGVALKVTDIYHNGTNYPVDVYVLHPETELPAFADDVDHHYIQRYVGLAAGLFISGFLESLVETTVTNTSSGVTESTGAITGTKDRIVYSLAKASDGFMPIFYDLAKRPVQVKVPKGQLMRLFFVEPVYEKSTNGSQNMGRNRVSEDEKTKENPKASVSLLPQEESGLVKLWN